MYQIEHNALYVTTTPTGTESGNVIGLDLGGTNFRIVLVVLKNGDIIDKQVKKYTISDDQKTKTQQVLFGHIASCIESFLDEFLPDIKNETIPLGFTFSFPCRQRGINESYRVHKEYKK